MCPMHSEARQTEMSEFGARERFIAGPCIFYNQLLSVYKNPYWDCVDSID